MNISSFYSPLSAMNAFGTGLGNSAHNLANVDTDSFKAGTVNYVDLQGSSGVQAQKPHINQALGPLKPYGSGLPLIKNSSAPDGFVRASNTDVTKEMINLINLSRAYQANAKVISASDSMLGMVLDIKV